MLPSAICWHQVNIFFERIVPLFFCTKSSKQPSGINGVMSIISLVMQTPISVSKYLWWTVAMMYASSNVSLFFSGFVPSFKTLMATGILSVFFPSSGKSTPCKNEQAVLCRWIAKSLLRTFFQEPFSYSPGTLGQKLPNQARYLYVFDFLWIFLIFSCLVWRRFDAEDDRRRCRWISLTS